MLNTDFLAACKRATEAKWSERSFNPKLYGFQFQRDTRWNPGLPDYESRSTKAFSEFISLVI